MIVQGAYRGGLRRVQQGWIFTLLSVCGLLFSHPAPAQQPSPSTRSVVFPSAAWSIAPPAAAVERGLIPPGALHYAVPGDAPLYLVPSLAVGTVLLLTDEYTIRAFRIEPLLADRGRGNVKPAPLIRIFSAVGDPPRVVLALVSLYAIGRTPERNFAKVAGLAYANAVTLTAAGKFLSGKERPFVSGGEVRYHGPNLRHPSFPSGHASGTAALAHVLAHYRPEARVLWYALSGATGLARIGMAYHWPSDVWFGWGVGIVAAEGALRQRERIEEWRPW